MRYPNVLVTGGAGFIGSHVVDLLLKQGRRVRVLDNLKPPTHRGNPSFPPGVEFQRGDVRCVDDLRRAMRSMDAVVHLAATGGFTPDIARYIEVNALGTAYLLEVALLHRIQKIVVASSVGIYGEGMYSCVAHGIQSPSLRPLMALEKQDWEPRCPVCGAALASVPTAEDKPAMPGQAYSISKYDQERLVLSSGIPSAALRFFLTYGPRQSLTNPYTGVVSIFSGRILNDLPPLLYEDGRQTRDFVYVEDAARAVALVLDEADGEVYNVGTGVRTEIRELARLLARLYGRDIEPECPGHYRPGEARHVVADIRKLSALGWEPRVALEEGLQRYIEWIARQGSVSDTFGSVLPELQRSGVVRAGSRPAHRGSEGLSVILPAYNEAGNLESIVRYLEAELPWITGEFEIVIVNDGSHDGTGPLADRLAAEDDHVRVIHHPFNIGFGGAQKTGFKEARMDWVAVVPADHQFDVRELRLFWERRGSFDLVASRRADRRDPPSRKIVSRLYNRTMRWLYGIELHDINWVKMWRRSLFDKIKIESRGFGVDAELVAKALALGFRVAEIEVPHHPRTWGSPTGLRFGTIYRTARELLRIRPMLRRMRNEAHASQGPDATPVASGVRESVHSR